MPFHVQPHFGSSSWRCTFGDSHAPAVPRRRKFYSTTVSLKTRRSNPCHPSCDPQKRAGFQQLKGHAAAHPSLAEAHTEVPFAKSAEDRAAALSNARPESETSGSYLQGEPPRQAAPILPVLAHFTRRYPKVVLEVLRPYIATQVRQHLTHGKPLAEQSEEQVEKVLKMIVTEKQFFGLHTKMVLPTVKKELTRWNKERLYIRSPFQGV